MDHEKLRAAKDRVQYAVNAAQHYDGPVNGVRRADLEAILAALPEQAPAEPKAHRVFEPYPGAFDHILGPEQAPAEPVAWLFIRPGDDPVARVRPPNAMDQEMGWGHEPLFRAAPQAPAEAREVAALAARDALVAMEWPPEDGDAVINAVMTAIRAAAAFTAKEPSHAG